MLVIYKDLAGLKVTPEENYNAYIRDEHKVVDCSAFSTPEDVIAYYVRWFGSKETDFLREGV